MPRKHKKSRGVSSNPARCPKCRRTMSLQYDTEAETPFWQCDACDRTYTLEGKETFYGTSVALDDPDVKEVK